MRAPGGPGGDGGRGGSHWRGRGRASRGWFERAGLMARAADLRLTRGFAGSRVTTCREAAGPHRGRTLAIEQCVGETMVGGGTLLKGGDPLRVAEGIERR